jgi:hypothetical protein
MRRVLLLALAVLLMAISAAFAAPIANPEWLAALDLSPYHAALLCSAAYEENRIVRGEAGKTQLRPSLPDAPFVPTEYELHGVMAHGNTELLALWHPSKKVLLLAFRGTSSIGDALDDLKARPVLWPFGSGGDAMAGVYVHDGFATQYASARADILATLARHPSAEHIVTMGHSLGAAISSIAAVDLAFAAPAVAQAGHIHSITFGSPRPGCASFVARYRELVKHTVRVVNEDIVCIAKNPLARIEKDACRDKVTQLPPAGDMYDHVAAAAEYTAIDTGASVHIGPSFELKLHSLATYEIGTFDSAADLHTEL